MNPKLALIDSYTAPDEAKQLARTTKITLLVGISGAGKDTIKKRLLSTGLFRDIVSHTTRQPRHNGGVIEVDGQDYHFASEDLMCDMVARREFIEVKNVHSTLYGTSIAELRTAHDEDKIAVTDIDVQGVAEYKRLASEVIAIFILPPDFATWRQRLQKRYRTKEEFESEWPKRRASAIRELRHALEVPYYHFILNDDLDKAVHTAEQIASKSGDVFNRKDDEARLAARDLLEQIEAN